MRADLVIVGSGFFGITIAQRAVESLGLKVLIIDKRNHIGGNSYSYLDQQTGIEVHKYGSHIFHTNNQQIWEYINRFSKFNGYEHRAWALHKGDLYSMPVNLQTISQVYKRWLSPDDAKKVISKSILNADISGDNLESKAISLVGKEVYEAVIRGYTKKQWGVEPRELPKEIITRLPVRYNLDNRYFSDRFQGLPLTGYGRLFEIMVNDAKIEILTETDFFNLKRDLIGQVPVVYTGPIDKYFDYQHGALNWRSLRFESETIEVADFQGASIINYPDYDVAFTRIHEFKHLHPERSYDDDKTFIYREYPVAADENHDPYYPVNLAPDRDKLNNYRIAASREKDVWFGGKLGSYKYLDMHMAIGSALTMFENEIKPHFSSRPR